MSKVLKIVTIVITFIIILLAIVIAFVAIDEVNKEKCYNLPLNDFYRDKSCLKYKERLIK